MLASLYTCNGARDGQLWLFIFAFGFPDQSKIFRRSMDFPRYCRDMDGKFLADLYVFQPFLVARSIRICCGAVSLVLGTNQTATNGGRMGHFGPDGRPDG